MEVPKILPYHIEKNMNVSEKIEYYNVLRNYCTSLKKEKNNNPVQDIISHLYLPNFYSKKLEIYGEENIPKDNQTIFVCNHSNSHDIFSMYSILNRLNIGISIMVATDCLNPITTEIFRAANSTLLDRRNKEQSNKSIFEMASKIISGNNGTIFGEATWNLHPIKPMQSIKIGASRIALLSNSVIIPTILEYVEVPEIVSKEIKLYDKIIIYFGKPITINYNESLEIQTLKVEKEMAKMRKEIWINNNIKRDKIEDIDPSLYINHTYLKKFKAFGFSFDSEKENKFLHNKNEESVENEYHLDKEGNFVPGIILKK